MTEIGHGSNVQGILTNAYFNNKTWSFQIITALDSGAKYWIGNLARTASYGVVFANLIIDDISYGVHSFIV